MPSSHLSSAFVCGHTINIRQPFGDTHCSRISIVVTTYILCIQKRGLTRRNQLQFRKCTMVMMVMSNSELSEVIKSRF